MKIQHLLLFALLLAGATTQAQNKSAKKAGALSPESIQKLHNAEDTLAVLSYAVINDSIEQERFAACKVLISKLVQALKEPNSFKYSFDRVKSVSIMAPPDSSFRIFTWQLFVNDSTYKYYGAIQMNSADLKLFPLADRSADIEYPLPTEEVLTADRWYGALYYNIRQFDLSKNTHGYLLCGFDAFTFFDKRKVVEVLTFDKEGKPVFGAPVFTNPDGSPSKQNRMMLEYSAEASVRCNWDEVYQLILFDHLIPMMSPFSRGMTYVPDGSYDGLKWEKGHWQIVDKVFNDVQDEAPRPVPVLDGRQGKGIEGDKPKKSGKQ